MFEKKAKILKRLTTAGKHTHTHPKCRQLQKVLKITEIRHSSKLHSQNNANTVAQHFYPDSAQPMARGAEEVGRCTPSRQYAVRQKNKQDSARATEER